MCVCVWGGLSFCGQNICFKEIYPQPCITFSQLVSNHRTVISFRLGDHHGGEGGDKAVSQRHVPGLVCGIGFLLCSTGLAAVEKWWKLPHETPHIAASVLEPAHALTFSPGAAGWWGRPRDAQWNPQKCNHLPGTSHSSPRHWIDPAHWSHRTTDEIKRKEIQFIKSVCLLSISGLISLVRPLTPWPYTSTGKLSMSLSVSRPATTISEPLNSWLNWLVVKNSTALSG